MPACVTWPPNSIAVPASGRRTNAGPSARCPRESCPQNPVPPPRKSWFDESGMSTVIAWWSLCARNSPPFQYTFIAGSRDENSSLPARYRSPRSRRPELPPPSPVAAVAKSRFTNSGKLSSIKSIARSRIVEAIASESFGMASAQGVPASRALWCAATVGRRAMALDGRSAASRCSRCTSAARVQRSTNWAHSAVVAILGTTITAVP
mmetsp:Transcript_36159/g.81273  ORF Transcript_36159/g.81273 Transcript_36159/m.81273 type:complete len:207 (-) Transcript_36159:426-1046(-)